MKRDTAGENSLKFLDFSLGLFQQLIKIYLDYFMIILSNNFKFFRGIFHSVFIEF